MRGRVTKGECDGCPSGPDRGAGEPRAAGRTTSEANVTDDNSTDKPAHAKFWMPWAPVIAALRRRARERRENDIPPNSAETLIERYRSEHGEETEHNP